MTKMADAGLGTAKYTPNTFGELVQNLRKPNITESKVWGLICKVKHTSNEKSDELKAYL